MKSLYLIYSNDKLDDKLNKQLLEAVQKKHKKVAVFAPIQCDKALQSKCSYTLQEAYKAYSKNQNGFFAKIIDDYECLKAEFDFVLVLGVPNGELLGDFEFNVNLAKELNTPIYALTNKENKQAIEAFLTQKLGKHKFHLIDENFKVGDFKEIHHYDFMTPNRFGFELAKKAKKDKKTVVLPESDDERILQAANVLLAQDLVDLILLGDESEIQAKATNLGLNLSKAKMMNPANSPLLAEFSSILYEARKEKGLSEEEAQKLVRDRTYFGTLLVHTNKAQAMVSGASTTTAETIRPALQLIKTKSGVSTVSGAFFMSLEDTVLFFADCAVTPNPTPEQIAEIAYTSASTAKAFGIEPKVAILSYSTGNSGSGVSVDASKEAVKFAKENYPDLLVDGPLQFDAAIDPLTAKSKMPDSKVAGQANVFIFPDLNAANIAYKAVQRTANALAIGPVLQGLKKPVNDLSRGCLVDDIVNTVILSAIQAKDN